MLKTIRIDKQLLAEAQKATGIHAPDELIHAGLKALIKKGAGGRRVGDLDCHSANHRKYPRRSLGYGTDRGCPGTEGRI